MLEVNEGLEGRPETPLQGVAASFYTQLVHYLGPACKV